MSKWRVGRKIGRNLYRGDEPIAMLATEELAQEIADRLNIGSRVDTLEAENAELRELLREALTRVEFTENRGGYRQGLADKIRERLK